MIPGDPIAVNPRAGRPLKPYKHKDLLEMFVHGGAEAVRALQYMMAEDMIRKRRVTKEKIQSYYLQAKMLGVIVDAETASIKATDQELERVLRELKPAETPQDMPSKEDKISLLGDL